MTSTRREILGLALAALGALLALPAGAAEPPPAPATETAGPAHTVAVLYFDHEGDDPNLAVLRKGLAQMLISDLAGLPSVDVVERERLQALIDEMKLGKSLRFDARTTAKLGKLLGARYVVVGGCFHLVGTLRVDARLVEVETGRIVQGVGAHGKFDDFLAIEQKLGQGLAAALTALPPPQPRPDQPPRAPRPRPTAVPPPSKLQGTTALRYAKALDLKDQGKKDAARAELKAVVAAQPDFRLAQVDLQRLMQ